MRSCRARSRRSRRSGSPPRGSPETFRMAGELGANVLTNLLGQSIEELVEQDRRLPQGLREDAGHAGDGHVTLMLHTFVGDDVDEVQARWCAGPFLEYLQTSTDLIKKARWEFPAFAQRRQSREQRRPATMDLAELTPEEMDAMLDHAFERYFKTARPVRHARDAAWRWSSGCKRHRRRRDRLPDRLRRRDRRRCSPACAHLDASARASASRRAARRARASYGRSPAQIRRHGVTHLQCTPSLARMLLDGRRTRARRCASLQQAAAGRRGAAAALAERAAAADHAASCSTCTARPRPRSGRPRAAVVPGEPDHHRHADRQHPDLRRSIASCGRVPLGRAGRAAASAAPAWRAATWSGPS